LVAKIQQEHPAGSKISRHHRTIYNYNVSRFRNEIAELTACDWIMIVDGDEIWPKAQIERFIATLKKEELFQTESVDVFQKRWSNLLEQQTNFAYIRSLIRAYRRSYHFLWKQSETIDFFLGERRFELHYSIDLSVEEATAEIDKWLTQINAAIELQSVEYAYRNYDGMLSTHKLELDVYFDHFSRCKGEKYLKDRVKRIHKKFLKTADYVKYDKTETFAYEAFIPLKQHDVIKSGLSIIIPTYNNLEGLRHCLDSIEKYAPGVPFEVILVNDNDETNLQKAAFSYAFKPKIVNRVKRGGYAEACNDGIRNARYDHFCLLNDDAQIVSENWAKYALLEMSKHEQVMIAGPLTNKTGGHPPVQYEEFGDAKFADCQEIAAKIADRPSELIDSYTAISGFCYFMKREVILQLGLLDEKGYPWGYGEENAYNYQVLKAGHHLLLLNGLFVWHEMGVTFDKKGINPVIDLEKIKTQNINQVIRLTKPKLIAYGRAKNEELIIEEQLRRMLSFCDEIVIHDTGSTDNTVRIAKSFDRVSVLETAADVTYNAAIQLNMALQLARSKNPDWLLYFDMDQFYDKNIMYEIDSLLMDETTDIWSFRLYDGRFCVDGGAQQYNLDFLVHTRELCEPCYRVLPALYRNQKDLMVAEPNDWVAWSEGDKSGGVSFPAEHCVLPIQYIDKNLNGSFYRRRIAKTIIRHLGNCISYPDLEAKKQFYTQHESHSDYADQWRDYPLELPRKKLMKWHEKNGTEVDLGSNLVKYINWDKDPAKRKIYNW
jgi:glycosyltransferase involved in cell wall biosynthesis